MKENNEKPSEHAIRARIAYNTQAGDLPVSLEEIIDTHAIKPAVEELVVALQFMVDVGREYYDMDSGPTGEIAINQAEAVLSKYNKEEQQ